MRWLKWRCGPGWEQEIAPHIQRSVQCMLMSATTSEDVKRLQVPPSYPPITPGPCLISRVTICWDA